jgi:hypothetical protein
LLCLDPGAFAAFAEKLDRVFACRHGRERSDFDLAGDVEKLPPKLPPNCAERAVTM